MTIRDLLQAVGSDVYVRIRVLGQHELTGVCGPKKTQNLIRRLDAISCADAYVIKLYPLFRCRELYIECVNVLE